MSSSPNGHLATLPSSSPRISDRGLSPHKLQRDRSTSRASSRNSVRTHHSTISLDDPVAVRNQVSTLKHTIRHQQAQLHTLENIIRVGPRPYAPELSDDFIMASTSSTSPPSAFATPIVSPATKMKRRSSYDVLQNIAGPDSSLPLPLPKRDGLEENGIREGIPMTFGVTSVSPTSYKRASSPTRTLSRIPVASVGNARALADEGQPATQRPSPSSSKLSPSPIDSANGNGDLLSSSSLQPPPSPNRRISLTPGGTTKVLADLQTGVVNARNALENTKAQLRLSQRSVAQLTRQTEDLKEGRERLRLENEGLNNVVARKERLLQEVLERARKAESEAATLRSQLKTETATSKKSLREMETALSESTALSQKSEREYITLRESIKGLVESWKTDTDRLRDEMRKREEKLQVEAESVGKKYRTLVEEVKNVESGREEMRKLREEDLKRAKEVEQHWVGEIKKMHDEVEASVKQCEKAGNTATTLSEELARLRRLMQSVGRRSSTDGNGPLFLIPEEELEVPPP